MSGARWLLWIALLLLFNGINSANSRAKNSRSLAYNAAITLLASASYLLILIFAGDVLLRARESGSVGIVALAVSIYATGSTLGSVLGHVVAMRWESRHREP